MDKHRFSVKSKKITAFIISIILLAGNLPQAVFAETPETVFTGDTDAGAVLANLDYNDVRGINAWAKPAIYEAGALGITKGFANMNRRFGRTDTMTREEALAVVYRAAGREAEAQTAGEALNNTRTAANKKTDVLQVWYDGFLTLAANDGLITQQQLADAMNTDQTALTDTSFRRSGAVQRQEMAYWLARALNLQPVRGQQDILNNYLDWRSADPEKVPFIETILQNKIMNGDGKGRFNPTGPVTREQAAQIVKNAESQILAALQYEKLTGTIENISVTGDYSSGTGIAGKNIDIRNSTGTLHRIETQSPPAGTSERGGTAAAASNRELVVYKDGAVGNSSLLKNGDRIEYIARLADRTIKYVNVLSNVNSERYVAAQINSIDTANRLLNVTQLFKLDFPDMALLRQNVSFNTGSADSIMTYRYGANAEVTVNGVKSSIDALSPDDTVILTINSANIITAIQAEDFGITSEERKIVKGIVEDNNPDLGYITLYNEDGSGTGANAAARLAAMRTFNYINQNTLEVLRNHSPATLDDIQTGDTAFLKLDDDGNVISISAVDNYQVKYGKVLSKLPDEIIVEYDDGTQQILPVGSDVLFIQDKKLTSFNSLKDGDRVKLLLNITNTSTELKEVTIEGDEHFISNIYKGEVSYIDPMSDKLVVLNLQVLNKGTWRRSDRKGFTGIPLADGYKIYLGDRSVDAGRASELLSGNEAYIAVEKDYGGEEKAVVVSYRFADDTEVRYSDDITNVFSGSGSFGLAAENRDIAYDAGSIVVKEGRLVAGSSLAENDRAYVVANRSYGSGDFNAGVVLVEDSSNTELGQIYRVRIKSIDDNVSFTSESFSQLGDTAWEYHNTPKTFNLTFNTRLLGDDGVLNIRDFAGYGDDSYINRVVYVLADGTDARLISTAPFGTINVKGRIFKISGEEIGEEGSVMTQPDGIRLRSVRVYDTEDFVWKDTGEMTLDLLKNTIVLKKGEVIEPSELKNGDTVRVIKKDNGLTGDAYIMFVE